MRKSPAVAYYTKKIRITGKEQLYSELEDAPLSSREFAFIADIIEGLDLDELATKYKISYSRVASWKREMFEVMHAYDMNRARHQPQLQPVL